MASRLSGLLVLLGTVTPYLLRRLVATESKLPPRTLAFTSSPRQLEERTRCGTSRHTGTRGRHHDSKLGSGSRTWESLCVSTATSSDTVFNLAPRWTILLVSFTGFRN